MLVSARNGLQWDVSDPAFRRTLRGGRSGGQGIARRLNPVQRSLATTCACTEAAYGWANSERWVPPSITILSAPAMVAAA